jgi:hypothetical protein
MISIFLPSRGAAVLLSLNLALAGCASCLIDALPQQQPPSEHALAFDCDPLIGK